MVIGWRGRALDRLAGSHPVTVWAMGLALAGLVTLADWWSHAEVAASLAYLMPIAVVAWGRDRLAAGVMAIACAGAWLFVDVLTHGDQAATATEIANFLVLLVAFLLTGQVLARLRGRLERERWLARTDPLTGIHNRRAFWNATKRELERCRRFAEPFSVAYLDVDGFKGVNDRFGHAAGDQLLRRIASLLQQELRQLDMVARLGGDEFALLLPGTNVFGASTVLTRVRELLRSVPWRSQYGIDCSIGCVTVLVAPADVDAVVARADQLMYTMKRTGRGELRHEVLREGDLERPPTTHHRRRTTVGDVS
jgi:diguanylate cyclase (GGDEF)-like protein